MDKLDISRISSELKLNDFIEAASKIEDVQVFDSDSVASRKHLELAFFHAQEAFKENSNFAKSLKMEFLLRAAATRQIKVAIERCGVKDPKKVILVVWSIEKNKGNKEDVGSILSLLNADKLERWKADESYLISLYGLDKKRKTSIEDQIIEKMVEVQIED